LRQSHISENLSINEIASAETAEARKSRGR
jgi:hypothetical protein